MLDMQPPQFEGSFEEQVIQAELWTRQFFENLETRMKEIEVKVANHRLNVESRISNKELITVNRLTAFLWDIFVDYEQDGEIYQNGNGWLVQRNTRNGIGANIKNLLITNGVVSASEPTSADVLSLISTIAPNQYDGNPTVIMQGNNFWVEGKMYEESEAED